jgi:hypothetical protein
MSNKKGDRNGRLFYSELRTRDRKQSVALQAQAGETIYVFVTFSACGPLGPWVTSNSTS